jgi:hypothetical protein
MCHVAPKFRMAIVLRATRETCLSINRNAKCVHINANKLSYQNRNLAYAYVSFFHLCPPVVANFMVGRVGRCCPTRQTSVWLSPQR